MLRSALLYLTKQFHTQIRLRTKFYATLAVFTSVLGIYAAKQFEIPRSPAANAFAPIGLTGASSIGPTAQLSASTMLVALGHDSQARPLRDFANRIESSLKRSIITYRDFANAHLIYAGASAKWWDELSFEQTNTVVEQAIRKAVAIHPSERVIVFDLDSFDPKELFGPRGEDVVSYTNFEVRLLLRDHVLYQATRWIYQNRELSESEAIAFWAASAEKLQIHPFPP